MTTYAYLRVSTASKDRGEYRQQFDSQKAELERAGYNLSDKQIFADRISGAAKEKPEFLKLLKVAQEGDLIVAYRLDRFGRSALEVIQTIQELLEKGISVRTISPKMDFDVKSPMSRFQLTLLSGLAELERDIIRERVMAGIEAAKKAGKHMGRPRVSSAVRAGILADRKLGMSVREICRGRSVSAGTVHKYLAEAKAEMNSESTNFKLDGGKISKRDKDILFSK